MKNGSVNTIELLAQLKAGDSEAQNRLVERAVPPLLKFARGRLPSYARGATDTCDIVQDVVLRALPRLGSFEGDGPGALQAFLRRAVDNQIVDEIRKARRRQGSPAPLDLLRDKAPSVLAQSIARQNRRELRAALATLSRGDRALIVERFGAGCRYAEVAQRLQKRTANAARTAVTRAVGRLAKALSRRMEKGCRSTDAAKD